MLFSPAKMENTMFRVIACLFAAATLSSAALAGEAPAEEELSILLHEFMTGASSNDMAAHDRFWSEDLVYTSSSGERYGKKEIMNSIVEAASANAKGPDITYLAENVRIRQYGDAAVIAFRLIGVTHDAEGSGRPDISNYFNTGTFVRSDGEWRVVAWQATRIPEE